jgi:anti-anti-sigma regulatory factor
MADAVAVDKITVGDHACLTFTDPDERLDLVADFVANGLHLGQRVICFTESVTPADLSAELALRDIAAGDAAHRGQLAVRSSRAWWTTDGPADSAQMINTIAWELRHATSAGFSGLRVTADMCWATRGTPAVEELIAFESQAARLFGDGELTVFCQYDRDSFDPLTLAFAADAHPKAVAAVAYHDTPLLRICRQHRPPGIRIAGEIDYTDIRPLEQALAEALRLDGSIIHVNLSKLRFIDVTAATTIAETAFTLPTDRTMIVTCTEAVAAVLDFVGAAQAPQLRILPRHP